MSCSDLIGYTHEFLAEFIQLYRSYPCLWQVRCKGYKDRLLRNRAYDVLVQKLREVNPIADRETVIRKINTLRTAFRREYKKVRSSQWMVKNPRHRYKSSLWYYDILKFVAEQNEDPGSSFASRYPPFLLDDEKILRDGGQAQLDGSREEMLVQADVDKVEPPSPVPSPVGSPDVPPIATFQPVILETEGSYARRYSSPATPGDHSRRKYQQETFQEHRVKEAIHEVSSHQSPPCASDDDFETFGRYVAGKLRKSVPRQSIIAEKIIADVLLRANLGTLEETTSLTEKVPSRCFLVMGDR